MKKTLLPILLCFAIAFCASTTSKAQVSYYKNAITYKAIATDYKTLQLNNFFNVANHEPGAEIAYGRYLNKSLNLKFPMRIGRMDYPMNDSMFYTNDLMVSGDATLVYKLNNDYILNEGAVIAPYLFAGAGVNYLSPLSEKKIDLQIPLGLGFNIKLWENLYLQLQGEYRFSALKDYSNLTYSGGLHFMFGKGKMEEPVIQEPEDRDGDGIVDAEDSCPDVPGIAEFKGCPDSDSDGVADAEDACPNTAGIVALGGCPDADGDKVIDKDDKCPNTPGPASNNGCPEIKDADKDGVVDADDKCPNEAGPASNNGCPLPKDSDGDGVIDDNDQCPSKAGPASNNGCPLPPPPADADKDGVIDANDRCPNEAGPASNKGCPEIKQEVKETLKFAMRSIQFETGSNTLKASSYNTLDQIAKIMADYPAYSLSISGYTDSVGDSGPNQKLSERRAKSCYDYLVSKGVTGSRMTYIGYGEANPIADNKTKEGRAINRRVEFNIFLR